MATGLPASQRTREELTSLIEGRLSTGSAKDELVKCGKPNGFSTKFAYGTPSTTGPALFQTSARVGNRAGHRFMKRSLHDPQETSIRSPRFALPRANTRRICLC